MQADRTLDRAGGGLGLGLALVKGLVELHGGEVTRQQRGPGTGGRVRRPAARWRRRRRSPRRRPSRPRDGRAAAAHPGGRGRRRRRRRPAARCWSWTAHEVAVARNGRQRAWSRRTRFGPTSCCATSGCRGWTATQVARAFRADEALRSTCPDRAQRLCAERGSGAAPATPASTSIWPSRSGSTRSSACWPPSPGPRATSGRGFASSPTTAAAPLRVLIAEGAGRVRHARSATLVGSGRGEPIVKPPARAPAVSITRQFEMYRSHALRDIASSGVECSSVGLELTSWTPQGRRHVDSRNGAHHEEPDPLNSET